ncbi:MAG: RNA-guided endonuclease InsQ/TnpB family protein [Xenococcaceae cyanobacterium]
MQIVYRFKLHPNKEQQQRIKSWQPMMRSFYNFCLRDRIDSYYSSYIVGDYCEIRNKSEQTPLTCSVNRVASIGYPWKSKTNPKLRRTKDDSKPFNPRRTAYEMQSSNLTYLREYRPWYQALPYDVLQQSLQHLNKAFNNFFSGQAKFPRFKKIDEGNSFEFKPKTVTIKGNRITLPGLGKMKFFKSRPLTDNWEIRTTTISIEADGFYVSILFRDDTIGDVPLKKPEEIKTITGVDVGINKLASLSTGEILENPRFSQHLERRLTIRARRLSRKKKGSKNRQKQAVRVARLHQNIRRRREDSHWKVALRIAQSGDLISFEDLNISGMKARCKPIIDPKTGKYQRNGQTAKAQLNKAISDAAWYSLRKKTEHQAAKLGNRLITVDPKHTSQQCSCCDKISPTNRNGEKFICESCGYYEDADIQAAKNIAKRAKELFFNGGSRAKSKTKKTQKKSKKSTVKNQRTKTKSRSRKTKSKQLPGVTRKVTPKSESTDSRKRDISLGLPDEPGNPVKLDKPVYKQLSLFNLQEWETG